MSAGFITGVLDRLENMTYDYRMKQHRQDVSMHEDIKLVLIDDASLQAMTPVYGRYPWPRSAYGELLDYFAMGGAKVVVFDILFSENEKKEEGQEYTESDIRLMQASAENGLVIHAFQLTKENPDIVAPEYLNLPMPDDFIEQHALHGASGFPDMGMNGYLLPMAGLYQSSVLVGMVGIDADTDGVFRRVKPFTVYQQQVYPSHAMAPLVLTQEDDAPILENGVLKFAGKEMPVDDKANYLVNMVGKHESYSVAGIFASIQRMQMGETEDLLVYPDEFADKIVYIGASAIGLEDIKTTPLSSKTPGVIIHASIVSNFLNNDFLKKQGVISTVVIVILFSFITLLGILNLKNIYLQSAVPVVLAGLYAAVSYHAYSLNYVFNMMAPIVAVFLAWLSTITYLVFTEGKDKQRVKNMFSQYVSPAVLTQVAENFEDQLQASVGKRENLSILFSDIRSFTNMSESLEAEQVVDLLNIYFSVMCDVVFKYNGTMDKFIGDAIMAFWGAPIRTEEHGIQSVSTAIEMMRELVKVNEQLLAKGYPEVAIGIGINTGEVILGNIGSERKLDYTVIGDGVNLASRLEGLTKQYGCPVIISEYTYEEIKQQIPCAIVDRVRVKGKQVPISIYWAMALPDDDKDVIDKALEFSRLAGLGFESYVNQDWENALKFYGELPDCKLKSLYIERCQNYQSNPPEADWDGVCTLTTK
ncbi:MAG: adenylate/guanylate cyclase domain-containing protein [Gammaproteobacteria bacterium]|nr:adenylate/guanylate cyclase domain-containing protein [Gammaproteobacteria bacterium]